MVLHINQTKKLKSTFHKREDGRYSLQSDIKGLVLSGGGAKGIAYTGFMKAAHENGFIEGLTHVSGASSGAIVASFIALGMPQKSLRDFSLNVMVHHVIDSYPFVRKSPGTRFKNVMDFLYLIQFQNLLSEINDNDIEPGSDLHNIKEKIANYKKILSPIFDESTILTTRHALSVTNNLTRLIEFTDCLETLSSNDRFTFKDMRVLRDALPDDKKHFFKKLYIGVSSVSEERLISYNEQTTPDRSIAEDVHASAAHPALFTSVKHNDGTIHVDGGLHDNMPQSLLKHVGLLEDEILCVDIYSNGQHEQELKIINQNRWEHASWSDRFADRIINNVWGGRVFGNFARTRNTIKHYFMLGNMLILNSKNVGVTSIHASREEKLDAIKSAYDEASSYFSMGKPFSSPLLAFVLLSEKNLDEYISLADEDPELIQSAKIAKDIFTLQQDIVKSLGGFRYRDVKHYTKKEDIRNPIVALYAIIMNHPELTNEDKLALATMCFKQIDYLLKGKLAEFLSQHTRVRNNPADRPFLEFILFLVSNTIHTILNWFKKDTNDDIDFCRHADWLVKSYSNIDEEAKDYHHSQCDIFDGAGVGTGHIFKLPPMSNFSFFSRDEANQPKSIAHHGSSPSFQS
jgi:VPS inhibitor protein D